MNRLLHSRYFQVVALVAFLMMLLIIRLFVLTVLEKEKWVEAATELSVKTVYTSAPRGEILDRNGKVLAGNKYTLSVQMSRGNMTDELTNQTIKKLIEVLDANGDTLYDNFPIKISDGKTFYYEQGTNTETFLETFGITEKLNAKDAFQRLRSFFKLDAALSDFEARKVMIVRNELAALGYKKYIPATVARNISRESIVAIEENGDQFPGVEVFTEVSRNYPNGNTGSHFLGYMGKISDAEKTKFVEKKGYKPTDLIGKDGLEKAYESALKGKDGEKKVQVDASGNLVKVIGETEAKKGKDVTLSVDLSLQKTAEKALKDALHTMQVGGTFNGKYGNYKMESAPNAQVGAVVALEVETGDVLAMASYPDYNPNLFAHGISSADWESLQSKNPRDPLAPAPLYNVATRSAVQPGSTFKMVTATAALQSGLNPNTRLYDDGYIEFGSKTFGCVAWNKFHKKHGYLNLQEALEVSCNYYFFDIATGQDFYTGQSLGYKNKMSIGMITDYAKQYGLGQATGIEIPETVTGVPSAKEKMANLKVALKNDLLAQSETFFNKTTVDNRKKLDKSINTICGWMGEELTRGEIEEKLRAGLGVKENQVSALSDLCKYTYFNQATWNVGDALNLSIGQGENAYTPLQMANYIATLGNNGVKNQISMVEKIEDHGTIEKRLSTKVKVDHDSYFNEIIGGMVRVANNSEGSLAGVFYGFPVTVAGKSGTAERAGKINPADEVAYIRQHLGAIAPELQWTNIETEMARIMKNYPDVYTTKDKAVRRAIMNLTDGRVTAEKMDQFKSNYDNFAWVVTMAPAEDPKIAVAVMVVQGGTATNAGPVAKEVLGKYFDRQEKKKGEYE